MNLGNGFGIGFHIINKSNGILFFSCYYMFVGFIKQFMQKLKKRYTVIFDV